MRTQTHLFNRNSRHTHLCELSRSLADARNHSASTGVHKNTLACPQLEISLENRPTQTTKFCTNQYFPLFVVVRLDSSTLVAFDRCLARIGFDWSASDPPSMQAARVIIETPPATRIRRHSFPTLTPDTAISRDSRALSGMREIILRRMMCMRAL